MRWVGGGGGSLSLSWQRRSYMLRVLRYNLQSVENLRPVCCQQAALKRPSRCARGILQLVGARRAIAAAQQFKSTAHLFEGSAVVERARL